MENQSVGIIVTYPKPGEKHSAFSGLSGYIKNLLSKFTSEDLNKIVVLSDVKSSSPNYKDSDVWVHECWHRGNVFFWWEIVSYVRKHPNLKTIFLQHEFNLFGGVITIPLSLLLLFIIKILLSRRVIVTLHGVVSIDQLDKSFTEINQLRAPLFLIRFGFGSFFSLLKFMVDSVIVHEDYFSEILVHNYNYNSRLVQVIHHGIEIPSEIISKDAARNTLGVPLNSRVVLFFGFVAGYKGVDILVEGFKSLNESDYILLFAGGIPKRLEKDLDYLNWYKFFVTSLTSDNRIFHTGFVPEEKIPLYFSAADILVLPYKYMLASSGPLSLAVGYKLPFIISKSFQEVYNNPNVLVDVNAPALTSKIQEFFESKTLKQSILSYEANLAMDRSWEVAASETRQLLFGNETN